MNLERIDVSFSRSVAQPPKSGKRISVVGLGYVGAVSTACLSALGHSVIGVDIDADKVDKIGRGLSPIHEKDLGSYLFQGVSTGLVHTTTNLVAAVRETDVTFISVGTPTAEDGGCDDSFIRQAARRMARGLRQKNSFHVFAMRCSIPPGTTLGVLAPIIERLSGKKLGQDFGICFNPEFLREGVAIEDFYNPPKTVIGATDARTAKEMAQIYAPVDSTPIVTTIEAAEMVKYVDNVWHAAKVCFANEIGRLCKPLGVDSHEVMEIFTQDTKLNLSSYYLKPGFAYGGSCLPKEVRAVSHMAQQAGIDVPMIANLDRSNKAQIQEAVRMVLASGAKQVGILGVAFKPGTDDLRESPALELMAELREAGLEVLAHDHAISSKTTIAGQLAYVRHASPGLQALAGVLPELLRDDLAVVTQHAEVLVTCHSGTEYREAIQKSRKPVVDLVRLFATAPAELVVDGIGW
ncbi:GDP-mannose 6-dehydrogenase AlgD [Roseobacter sp. SK209-2-6]|uniref:nucleotide sugar dehydrogenase n=1 Tax=Roseobacter sp. SK209-2-6 TaxID=388739 RepID=UPI0000F3F851|nr:nucleotide sugar dehydrogenase [Roseobacter sp. SK209-2-6]EBA18048.1 GDP-mannose 6-dehydrogenase AlgD [Roseobacter sp. SK209-2-6]